MQRFDLNQIAASPWKNGGGSTREIACWPPGAGMEAFGWRISVATIDQPGPFSAFAGVDRQIMLLDGDGVHLRGEGIDHVL
ncbi:HutD/Ves family protein, partial [Klebsiella pneumoniae]